MVENPTGNDLLSNLDMSPAMQACVDAIFQAESREAAEAAVEAANTTRDQELVGMQLAEGFQMFRPNNGDDKFKTEWSSGDYEFNLRVDKCGFTTENGERNATLSFSLLSSLSHQAYLRERHEARTPVEANVFSLKNFVISILGARKKEEQKAA